MKIIFLGDSTMQFNDETTFPQVGWPQALYEKINSDIEIYNFAKNGRSTKTFIEEGIFDKALEVIDDTSKVVIEFGHNDSHDYDPKTYTRPDYEYRDNLAYMINKAREKGAYVILLTPIYRRWFNEDGSIKDGCHQGYREAGLKLATELGIDSIDMTSLTKKMLSELGVKDSRELFMNFDKGIYPNYPDGLDDNTHLRLAGAKKIRDIFLNEVKDNKNFEGYFK